MLLSLVSKSAVVTLFSLTFIVTVRGQLPHRYDRVKKTWSYQPVVQNDPDQVQSPHRVRSNNLFGWLNLKHYVRFRLWTRKNPVLAHELKVDSVESFITSSFDAKRLTKIVIPGLADSANEVYISEYLLKFRDTYLKFSDVNVIVVDYSLFALPVLYLTSLYEVAAEKLADLIQFMVSRMGVKWESLHIVGVSLGCHIGGIAGHKLNGKIGRITGLDPAGPLFKFVDNEYRLDRTDAKFVDLVHTNGGTRTLFGGHLGLANDLGHVDFHPNGGRTQIGCPRSRLTSYESHLCSHVRVVGYYLESISSPLAFPMCPCNSLESFVVNDCPCTDFSYMGEHISHKTRGIFYGITRAKTPYGHGPEMQVTLPNVEDETTSNKKIHRKRSNSSKDLDFPVHNDDGSSSSKTRRMAEIIYRNQTQYLDYHNEFSADKFPNDQILDFCLTVKSSVDHHNNR